MGKQLVDMALERKNVNKTKDKCMYSTGNRRNSFDTRYNSYIVYSNYNNALLQYTPIKKY